MTIFLEYDCTIFNRLESIRLSYALRTVKSYSKEDRTVTVLCNTPYSNFRWTLKRRREGLRKCRSYSEVTGDTQRIELERCTKSWSVKWLKVGGISINEFFKLLFQMECTQWATTSATNIFSCPTHNKSWEKSSKSESQVKWPNWNFTHFTIVFPGAFKFHMTSELVGANNGISKIKDKTQQVLVKSALLIITFFIVIFVSWLIQNVF